jgi:pSer/pThr/pTyr-binding forkhead associated (FHA) protein
MLALYRCGRQSNALEAFQRARRRLAEELGLQPGPVLRAMEASVLAHDPELDHIAPTSSFAHLIVNDGPGAQRLLRLDARRRLTLGRDPSNDITLPEDATVSRLHALLECIHGSWILSDDGVSSNGTFCNEERVRLGDTLLVFRDPRSAAQDGTLSKPA